MDIRPLTPNFAVSPQIDVADIPAIIEAGYRCILCNRPDGEVMSEQQAATIQDAAEKAGLSFAFNPIENGAMTEGNVSLQAQTAIAAQGPVLAYCRSGTRSAAAWLLASAPATPSEELLAATEAAGYQLGALKPQMDQLYTG
ncbi:TIGR01244 family phosphatase [Alphaproteobacteria bacterium KMM 3653]|uniref:TIGR01244 family phosphatase n=1 Tax=Harenicola maris TaxID=2841044 RepID=A0AAP2CSE2_9RHOB|nr:TIGR01244 family phosphatase [Harenicola maris]